jgi:hypothetical protein
MFEGTSSWDPFRKRRPQKQLSSEETSAELASPVNPGSNDWPSEMKETEWLLKYPPQKEAPPESWPESEQEEVDSTANMPDMHTEELSYNYFETMPDKNDSEFGSDQSSVVPGKTSGSYEYPKIDIEGEDKKLFKLFKKIPLD